MSRLAHITGWGVASALGVGRTPFRKALLRGEIGITRVRRFNTTAFGTHVGALVAGYEEDTRDPTLLCHEFGMLAAREALEHAGFELNHIGSTRVAMTLGASLFGDHDTHDLVHGLVKELGLRGPAITVSTACTSSTQAIGFGADLIREGFADVVLAGGIDALTSALFSGFHALGVLSERPCRPFSRQIGTTLGEGAGFLVLERSGLRHAVPFAQVRGYGLSGDAYHETSPEPRGRGVAAAIRGALEDARVSVTDIEYFNAHGTGTAANDTAEWCAVQAVFGDELARRLPLSSSKGHLGHAQSAAGVLEVITTLECMRSGRTPTTAGFDEARPGGPPLPVSSPQPEPRTYELALSNNSAFGGSNCALVFGCVDPAPALVEPPRRVFLSGAAALHEGALQMDLATELPRADLRGIDRATELLIAAVHRALSDANVRIRGKDRERTGLIAGVLRASPDSLERFHSSLEQRGLGKPDTKAFAQVLPSAAQSGCAKALNIRGPQSTITVGEGSGLMAAAMSAWMLARRRDADRMIAAAVDVRPAQGEGSAVAGGACALIFSTVPTPIEVVGLGIAGPEHVGEAVAEARRRWGARQSIDLVLRAPDGPDGMPASSSAFSLARAVDGMRCGDTKSAVVSSSGATASVAMILARNEVEDEP